MATKEKDRPEAEQQDADQKGEGSFTEEDRTPAEEMTTLGQCRYCEEDAVRMATHKDGTGWVAICDKHEKDAKDDDFEPAKETDPSVS